MQSNVITFRMKRTAGRSHCPVNYSLETFGDTWSLLIVRDIVFWGKATSREFLASEERIATNILTSRLQHLVRHEILDRTENSEDRRQDIYRLTDKGLDLIPILVEICGWSFQHDPLTTAPKNFVDAVYGDRVLMNRLIRDHIRAGGSLFGKGSFRLPSDA